MLNRLRADVEADTDLGVGQPVTDQRQDLLLPLGQARAALQARSRRARRAPGAAPRLHRQRGQRRHDPAPRTRRTPRPMRPRVGRPRAAAPRRAGPKPPQLASAPVHRARSPRASEPARRRRRWPPTAEPATLPQWHALPPSSDRRPAPPAGRNAARPRRAWTRPPGTRRREHATVPRHSPGPHDRPAASRSTRVRPRVTPRARWSRARGRAASS